jgi:hypothetical protein
MKSLFEGRILIDMQIFNIWLPFLLRNFVPPRPPANKSIKTGNKRICVPNLTKDGLHLRPSSNIPRSLRMTAPI